MIWAPRGLAGLATDARGAVAARRRTRPSAVPASAGRKPTNPPGTAEPNAAVGAPGPNAAVGGPGPNAAVGASEPNGAVGAPERERVGEAPDPPERIAPGVPAVAGERNEVGS
jgi:hypothetical protein